MSEIVSLFTVFSPHLSAATLRQFCEIVFAVLAMTGGVTMRNISRWTSKGGSYRTIQRFYNTLLPWGTLCWVFFREHLFDPESVHLLAGDESIVAKSGDETHGLSRFSRQPTVKRYAVWRFLRCPSSVSRSAVHTRCLWNRSSGAKHQRHRKKPLFQKLRKQKETSRDARKGARIETRPRASSMTP